MKGYLNRTKLISKIEILLARQRSFVAITTVFVDKRLWKTKHARKHNTTPQQTFLETNLNSRPLFFFQRSSCLQDLSTGIYGQFNLSFELFSFHHSIFW